MGEKTRDGNSSHICESTVFTLSQPAGLTNSTKATWNLQHCVNNSMAIKTFFSSFTYSL